MLACLAGLARSATEAGGSRTRGTRPSARARAGKPGAVSMGGSKRGEIRLGEMSQVIRSRTNSHARDAWREAAETFGTVVVDEGEDWLKVED